jgi:hypothetical protein
MTKHPDISPKRKAALMRQLEVANARLLSIARERQRLKDEIASLTALLKQIRSCADARERRLSEPS